MLNLIKLFNDTFNMKKICLSLMVAMSYTMAFAADNKNTPTQTLDVPNTFKVITRPEISGLWGMHIQSNSQCIEYYNFKGNNNVVIKSGAEWSSGIYEYQPVEDPTQQIPALVLQVKYDNNEKDCSGNQEDQTGEISQYFVKWTNPTTINFCATEKGEQCFATLNRILP